MNNITDALNQRIKQAEAELAELDADLEKMQRRKSVLARYVDVARSLLDMERQQAINNGAPAEEATGKRFAGKSLTQATSELLLEANRPLHVKEIWKGVVEGGFVSRATKPLESLTSRLTRDKRFVNIGHRTFKLAAWDGKEGELHSGINGGREAVALKFPTT